MKSTQKSENKTVSYVNRHLKIFASYSHEKRDNTKTVKVASEEGGLRFVG